LKHRLFIISGKGGTGKTSFSLALAKLLQERGLKVKYSAFDHDLEVDKLNELKIPFINTTLQKSCERYIGLKLKSETIARWIMKTPFFSALFSILPSLGSMILLGNYIKDLEEDPELIIILDSPATGHAKSMIDATSNFKEIFKAGVLVEDIQKMQDFMYAPNNIKSFICSLPTEMSLQEAGELKSFMINNKLENTSIILNNYIEDNCDGNSHLSFLNNKITAEKEIVSTFTKEESIHFSIPKMFYHEPVEVICKIKDKIVGLI
jgi:anion-transporting  ArsA/GET3 family ATPase